MWGLAKSKDIAPLPLCYPVLILTYPIQIQIQGEKGRNHTQVTKQTVFLEMGVCD